MPSTCPKCIAPVDTSGEAIGVNFLDLESGGELLRGAGVAFYRYAIMGEYGLRRVPGSTALPSRESNGLRAAQSTERNVRRVGLPTRKR
jgi:hypothetical protein